VLLSQLMQLVVVVVGIDSCKLLQLFIFKFLLFSLIFSCLKISGFLSYLVFACVCVCVFVNIILHLMDDI
jgi:hypothetical protein